MPYFVYRVSTFPIPRLACVEAMPSFSAASAKAKALRNDPSLAQGETVRVVFAESELAAEELLTTARTPKPGLDGDE